MEPVKLAVWRIARYATIQKLVLCVCLHIYQQMVHALVQEYLIVSSIREALEVLHVWYVCLVFIMLKEVVPHAHSQVVYFAANHSYANHNACQVLNHSTTHVSHHSSLYSTNIMFCLGYLC